MVRLATTLRTQLAFNTTFFKRISSSRFLPSRKCQSYALTRPLRTSFPPRRSKWTPMRVCCTISESPSPLTTISETNTTPLTTSNVPIDDLSPMMRHYAQTKQTLMDTLCDTSTRRLLLLYRVGDFFESFFEDARLLSSVCGLTLTSKDAGKALNVRAPMAGVPHHAIEDKIRTLLQHNITVAVVDQVQAAADVAPGKLVKRAVTRLITPGTVVDDSLLDSRKCSYLASLVIDDGGGGERDAEGGLNKLGFGFAYADVSTGEFKVTDGVGLDAIHRVLVSVAPAELLLVCKNYESSALCQAVVEEVQKAGTSVITRRKRGELRAAEKALLEFHCIDNLESIGCRNRPLSVEASAVLLSFARDTLSVDNDSNKSVPLNPLRTFALSEVMLLDGPCLRNMEIIETVRDGDKSRTLLWAVDRTVTAMGARRLRSWLLAPSMSLQIVRERHSVVEALCQDAQGRRIKIQQCLRCVADLERLAGRVATGRATPREVRSLVESILRVPAVLNLAKSCVQSMNKLDAQSNSVPVSFHDVNPELLSLAAEVENALVDPAPSSLTSEMLIRGGVTWKENWELSNTQIFRRGYCEELDALKKSIEEPDIWIRGLEEAERERTNIDSLRIKHIKNTGYVLRIPRSIGEKKMDEDPMFFARLGYERVQSTKAELRFRFHDLKMHESSHHAALSRIALLELRLYNELLSKMSTYVNHIRELAEEIAAIDVLAGFAQLAEEHDYVRPSMLEPQSRILHLEDARHPVVEQTLPIGKTFVPNSFRLGTKDTKSATDLMVICGPNAAGKSCALRSVGLIYILAQAGCFVPAQRATLSLCDRVFTRVGAVDDLARGQSTFQVEMAETACILAHAKSSSLVLLDEIGRGTSTVDGIAIAWSVCEYLARRMDDSGIGTVPPRTMFVTHYHELNQLATTRENVGTFRVHMNKREWTNEQGKLCEEWITTHKLIPGASFESLGLAVARRAGFPTEVMVRAEEIASMLREPSLVLGAELSKAMANAPMGKDAPNVEASAEPFKGVWPNAVTTETNEEDESYTVGFKQGYAQAMALVSGHMKELLAKLQKDETNS